MKSLNSAFKIALSHTTLTLAWCWLIERSDGIKLGFTSFDLPLEIDGITYHGITGFTPGAAQQSIGLDRLDSQNLIGILDNTQISSKDLSLGLYDGAKVRRFLVDYTDLPTDLDATNPKHLELPWSFFASIKRNPYGFEVQTSDDLSLLDNQVGKTTSQTCRTNLGSATCRVNLANYTHNLRVTGAVNDRILTVNGNLRDKYFDDGRLTFTSGLNDNLRSDIAFYKDNKIILFNPTPFTIAVGDTLTAIAGCAKTKLACIKYNNFINFQGEPDIPTTDLAINTPVRTTEQFKIFDFNITINPDGTITGDDGDS